MCNIKYLLLLFILSTGLLSNQRLMSQTMIRGSIRYRDGKGLQFASVLLLKSRDSSLVKGTIADDAGNYIFDDVKEGRYLVAATSTGRAPVYAKAIEVAAHTKEIDNGILYCETADNQLNNVTVTAKKPMFEQKIDRLVINVKNSLINASGTALDVLEKSPGVTVNRQANSVGINGKSGVMVMINGKINYMPMEALVQLLSATSADNIERIELITSPPAKYDAEGNAGYINIVMVNNPYAGFSGSYFANAGYGKRALGAAGIVFNYRSSKFNFYGNYSSSYSHNLQPSLGFSQFAKAGGLITNTSFSNRDATTGIHNIRAGIDYQLDTSTIIGALIGGYSSHWIMDAANGATIANNNLIDTIINTYNREINHWDNLLANLNVQHSFKNCNTIYLDANYIYYKDNNPNSYSNTYFNNQKEILYREDLKSEKATPINFKVLSFDYTYLINKKVNMETGAKYAASRFTNDVKVGNVVNGIVIPNTGLSATYFLNENIAAAYSSIIINSFSKTYIKAGIRYELTTSNLNSGKIENTLHRKYEELFPSFFISQKLKDNTCISFAYSRRITRPSFNDLAPFAIFFDPKTFFSGSPGLQPAIANTLQLNLNLKQYFFSVSYTMERNTIESYYFQTQKIDTINNIVYLAANNFKSERYLNASFSIPVRVRNWWSMQNNFNYNLRAVGTTLNEAPVRLSFSDYKINSTQSFTFPREITLELTGFYSSAGYFGTTRFAPLYQLNAGLQKKLNNKEDIIRLTANDIFNSGSDFKFTDNLAVKNATVNRDFNFGLVAYKISYTHNFGNKALKAKRERTTGAEDELNRVRN